MNTHLLSLLAGTALIATVSVAQASEPTALSESQMDQVSAGLIITGFQATGSVLTINGVQATIEENGGVTINGVPVEDFTNLLFVSGSTTLRVAQGENLRVELK